MCFTCLHTNSLNNNNKNNAKNLIIIILLSRRAFIVQIKTHTRATISVNQSIIFHFCLHAYALTHTMVKENVSDYCFCCCYCCSYTAGRLIKLCEINSSNSQHSIEVSFYRVCVCKCVSVHLHTYCFNFYFWSICVRFSRVSSKLNPKNLLGVRRNRMNIYIFAIKAEYISFFVHGDEKKNRISGKMNHTIYARTGTDIGISIGTLIHMNTVML